jgi:hypothetical protein
MPKIKKNDRQKIKTTPAQKIQHHKEKQPKTPKHQKTHQRPKTPPPKNSTP